MRNDDLLLHVNVDPGAVLSRGGVRKVSGPIERVAATKRGVPGRATRFAMGVVARAGRMSGLGRVVGVASRANVVAVALLALAVAAIAIMRGESGRSFSNMGQVLRDKVLGAKVVDLAAEIMAASDVAARPMLMRKIGMEGRAGPGFQQALQFYDWRYQQHRVMQRGIHAIMLDPALQANSIEDVIALQIYEFLAPAWNALKRAARSMF